MRVPVLTVRYRLRLVQYLPEREREGGGRPAPSSLNSMEENATQPELLHVDRPRLCRTCLQPLEAGQDDRDCCDPSPPMYPLILRLEPDLLDSYWTR